MGDMGRMGPMYDHWVFHMGLMGLVPLMNACVIFKASQGQASQGQPLQAVKKRLCR